MLTTHFASSASSADATMSVQQDFIKGNAVTVGESRYLTMGPLGNRGCRTGLILVLLLQMSKNMFSQFLVISSVSFSAATHQICRLARTPET